VPGLIFLLLPLLLLQELKPQELKHSSASARPGPDLPGNTLTDNLAGLLSSHRLNPPLRAGARLRFSPDGSHLLIQDQAGIFVLSHKPLKILLYADIGRAYPAAFSADSQGLSILGRDLVLTAWHFSVPDKPQRRELPVQHGCLDAQLSPDAAWIACFTPEFFFDLYRASDFQRVYSQRLGSAFADMALSLSPGTAIRLFLFLSASWLPIFPLWPIEALSAPPSTLRPMRSSCW